MGILTLSQEYTTLECSVCGSKLVISTFSYEYRCKNGGSVYCPHGHQLTVPIEDTVKVLRREVEDLKRSLENKSSTLAEKSSSISNLVKQVTYWKGLSTRYRNKCKALEAELAEYKCGAGLQK